MTDTIAFRVDLNGVAMGGFTVANAYKRVVFSACRFDLGNRWKIDAAGEAYWEPVCEGEDPALVQFGGQIWLVNTTPTGPYIAQPNFCAKVWKNNQTIEVGTAIGAKSAFNFTWVHNLNVVDVAQPGDRFKLYQFVSDTTVYLDGHRQHTFWTGHVVGGV